MEYQFLECQSSVVYCNVVLFVEQEVYLENFRLSYLFTDANSNKNKKFLEQWSTKGVQWIRTSTRHCVGTGSKRSFQCKRLYQRTNQIKLSYWYALGKVKTLQKTLKQSAKLTKDLKNLCRILVYLINFHDVNETTFFMGLIKKTKCNWILKNNFPFYS